VVFFNYTTMQVSAKIVYYGPGLCGKTTNLQQIHGRTDPGSRGEMVSLETEADRTLFFDLLPLEVGTIGGMRVRLQLYTVPGQVFYNTTRKLVLKGVDGIVFVADSQEPMLDANMESLTNLKRNLEELNQPLEKIPFLFQYNKRDLRNILTVDTLNRHLNREGFEVFEGAALHGVGVFETLKAISRKTLAAVHRKISGEEEPPLSVRRRVEAAPGRVAEEPPAARETARAGVRHPSDTLFAELQDDLDPEAVAINEHPIIEAEVMPEGEPDETSPETVAIAPQEANTAEVKVEFALNPAVAGGAAGAGKGTVRKVETQSRLDIERELEKLRRLAFGGARGRKTEPAPPIVLTGKGSARVPVNALEKASGVVVDLRLVSEASTHSSPGVLRIELPPREKGVRTRLQVDIEIEEDGPD
jgi:signal recognition particle receptor subunit beta